MTKLGRKAAPYLLAGSISLPFACSKDLTSPYQEPVQTAEQFSQKYTPLLQSGNYSLEEMVADAGAVKLSSATEITPKCDLNNDGKTNVFDLIYFLVKFGNNEDCDVNKDGKTNVRDLITLLQVLGGNYGTISISGRLLDTDTWQSNTELKGWVECLGDTTWTDNNGNYSKKIEKQDLVNLTAGYKDKDGKSASFVRTINNINANTNQNIDIAVCTYLDMNTTPEEFRIMMYDVNFGPVGASDGSMNYEGAKTSRKDMVWYLIKKGRYKDEFTNEQWIKLQEMINKINTNLKKPLPIVTDTTGWYPQPGKADGKIVIERWLYGGAGSIGSKDYNSDGRIDGVFISLLDPVTDSYAVEEEGASALGGYDETNDIRLKDKTIFYEAGTEDIITDADKKCFRLIECIGNEVGQLYPKMPMDEVLKLQ